MTPETAAAIGDAFVKVLQQTKGNYVEVQTAALQALAAALKQPDQVVAPLALVDDEAQP